MHPTIEVAVLIMHKGEVLIGRRIGGNWEIPGSSIQPFEEMKTSAIRSVFELSNLTVDPQNILFVSEVVNDKKAEHRVIIYLYAKYIEGELKPDVYWDEAEWVDVRKLGNLQEEMDEHTIDAFYKFSMVLRQSADKAGVQA